jgi:Tfp pilus assembly protein PilN
MNTATITDIAWEGAQLAFRLIMAARSRRDAEAIVHQLRALGPAQRADVDAVEADARRRLRQDEPTQASPLEKRRIAPDFHRDPDACQECHRMPCVCDVRPLIGGPLGEGD